MMIMMTTTTNNPKPNLANSLIVAYRWLKNSANLFHLYFTFQIECPHPKISVHKFSLSLSLSLSLSVCACLRCQTFPINKIMPLLAQMLGKSWSRIALRDMLQRAEKITSLEKKKRINKSHQTSYCWYLALVVILGNVEILKCWTVNSHSHCMQSIVHIKNSSRDSWS